MGLFDRFRAQPEPAPPESPTAEVKPKGGSGRGHNNGYLQLEERNWKLMHPQGHEIYDEMYRTDGDVHQAIQIVVNPIVGGTWQIQPFNGQNASERDQQIAEYVRWALWENMRPTFTGHLIEFLPVLFRSGFAPGEIVWEMAKCPGVETEDFNVPAKDLLVPKTVELRLPRSVMRWEQKGNELTGIWQMLPAGSPAMQDKESSENGDPGVTRSGGSGLGQVFIPSRDLVYYRVGAEGDNWEGVSLLRSAYKHWFMKDMIERLDAIAQEREAVGIPVVYTPPGASDSQIEAMDETLNKLRAGEVGWIRMPGMKAGQGAADNTGWLFELVGYDSSGSGRDPQASLSYHTNKIAAAFISEFMRLGHGATGARATAEVQADPFQQSIEALVTLIEQTIQDALIMPLVAYNFPEVDNPPRLVMSLVDSTSLTQLADFVLKLTQVGALLPDQELEDFLRARADLPPANPKSVKGRKDDEETIRRMIVGGNPNPTPADEMAAQNPDPFGSNAKVGKHKNGKPAGEPNRKGTANGAGGGSAGQTRGAGKRLDDIVDPDDPEEWMRISPAVAACDLSEISRAFDEHEMLLEGACKPHIRTMAREIGDAHPPELESDIAFQLADAFRKGHDHVCSEVGCRPGHRTLSDRQPNLDRRARLGAKAIHSAMMHARELHELNGGSDATIQLAMESEGDRVARKVAGALSSDAYQFGRHEAITELSDGIQGVYYTSVLDSGTCEHCRAADDGVLRSLDDPVRLDRKPPNHHCSSTASGFNQCRCFEVPSPLSPEDRPKTLEWAAWTPVRLDAALVPNDPAKTNWVEKRGGLPKYIADIAGDLITERGMDTARAIAVAVNRVKQWARGGGGVSPQTQAKAAEALAQWDSMKASARR